MAVSKRADCLTTLARTSEKLVGWSRVSSFVGASAGLIAAVAEVAHPAIAAPFHKISDAMTLSRGPLTISKIGYDAQMVYQSVVNSGHHEKLERGLSATRFGIGFIGHTTSFVLWLREAQVLNLGNASAALGGIGVVTSAGYAFFGILHSAVMLVRIDRELSDAPEERRAQLEKLRWNHVAGIVRYTLMLVLVGTIQFLSWRGVQLRPVTKATFRFAGAAIALYQIWNRSPHQPVKLKPADTRVSTA
jgi:hypothetical protein